MIVLQIDSNMDVPAELERVVVTVSADDAASTSTMFLLDGGSDRLPLRLGLVSGQGSRAITVSAVGLRGQAPVAREDAVVRFARGKALLLPLFLARECAATNCPTEETCTAGGTCVARERDPALLPPFDPASRPQPRDGGRRDLAVVRDAAPEAADDRPDVTPDAETPDAPPPDAAPPPPDVVPVDTVESAPERAPPDVAPDLPVEAPAPPLPPANGTGVKAEYFDNPDLTALRLTRLDPRIDFDWGTGAPASGFAGDSWSVRWTGQLQAPASGELTFHTISNDGVRLWIDGVLLVDNWTVHPVTENTGRIVLVGGRRYDLKMELFDDTGPAVARLLWSFAGTSRQVVPQNHLYPAP